MRIKSEKNFWAGLIFIAVGIGFALGALNYSFGSSARPGPAYFPFGLGLLQALLGAVLVFGALTFETPGGDKIGPWPIKQGGIIVASVVVFGIVLPPLGLAISLPLLIGIGSLASGEFRIKEVLMNSAILTVASWAIFIKGLGLTLPLWPAFVG